MMRPSSRRIILLAALFALLYLTLAYAFYVGVASRVLGANDYYSRWMGSRLFFLQGLDPYSDAATRQIQLGMFGRLVPASQDQVAFAYPLYAAFFTYPFITLTFTWAASFWIALLIMVIGGAAIALALNFEWRPSPLGLVGLLAFALLAYPSVRGFFLGQYALLVSACVAFGLLLLKGRRDEWAGCVLALSTVKPHIVIVALAIILSWGAFHRRWGLIRGFLAVLVLLLLTSAFFLPGWVLEFMQAVGRYKSYTDLGPPIQVLSESLLPTSLADPLSNLFSILLFGALVYKCWRTLGATWNDFLPTIELALVVTTMAMIRTATADQTLLLVPWIHWLANWNRSGHQRFACVIALSVLAIPWAIFLSTLHGNQEAPIATAGAVSLTLVGYFAFYHNEWFPAGRLRADGNLVA